METQKNRESKNDLQKDQSAKHDVRSEKKQVAALGKKQPSAQERTERSAGIRKESDSDAERNVSRKPADKHTKR